MGYSHQPQQFHRGQQSTKRMHQRMKVNMAVALLQDTTRESEKFLKSCAERKRGWKDLCLVVLKMQKPLLIASGSGLRIIAETVFLD